MPASRGGQPSPLERQHAASGGPSCPHTRAEERKTKAVISEADKHRRVGRVSRGREMPRSRSLPGATASLGNPFPSPRVTQVGRRLWWEAWCAHGDTRAVAYVAKTVSFSTAFRQVRTHRCPFS